MRILFALLIAGPVFAQGYTLREGDQPFGAEALEGRLSGQVLVFFDDGQSEYYPDGRYTYTYAGDGGTAYGYWRVTGAGEVCVDYVNGFSRCDLYVMNGGRLLLLDDKGARYPVRP
ncbi:hypothetical protein [Antarctobacter jejuensis]|uniref:hypothetical protein n=1 Tax=Antarctobacter jejuensis TaxID=1439938 RepID=UPI003FD600B3